MQKTGQASRCGAFALTGIILLAASPPAVTAAVGAQPAHAPPPPGPAAASPPAQVPGPVLRPGNARLAELVAEDQADRRAQPLPKDIDARDDRRRAEAMALVRDGLLETADDWAAAGLMFQHSHEADDILVAHVLFTVGALEGSPRARFFFAASLDRLLQQLDRPQFFATQPEDDGEGQWRMPPAHPLLGPKIRAVLNVPGEQALAARIEMWRTIVGPPPSAPNPGDPPPPAKAPPGT